MPNRILREAILSSDRIDQLDAAAEVFYRRLMSKVDDHGLYDGRPSMLRSSLYPLRVDRVREADISRWIAACEKAGLIALYERDGKPYLWMLDTRWQVRAEPKYPLPPERVQATDNSCAQPPAAAPVFVGVVGVEGAGGSGRAPPVDNSGRERAVEQLAAAMRRVGLDVDRINTHDPRALALLEQGATIEEFEGLAREAVSKQVKWPWLWVLKVLPERRTEAAGTALPPPPKPTVQSDAAERTLQLIQSQQLTPEEYQASLEAKRRVLGDRKSKGVA